MKLKVNILAHVWHSDTAGWLMKFHYNSGPDDPQINFVYIDVEDAVETDLERRFPQRSRG